PDTRESRRRLATARAHDDAPAIRRVALERRLHDGIRRAGVAPHEREVFLAEALLLELPRERELRDVRLRDDDHSARVLVEPMDDPRSTGLTAGPRAHPSEHRIHEGPGLVTVRGMDDETGGLVHDDDVLVL